MVYIFINFVENGIMMSKNNRFKIEWLIIGLLLLIIVAGAIFFTFNYRTKINSIDNDSTKTALVESNSVLKESKQEEILKKYEKLENAYNTTLKEIESVSEDDNMNLNLSILKENLNQILLTIKEEKDKINKGKDSSVKPEDNTKQLEDLLNMSKEVLAERLLEEKNKNEKLTIDNRKLNSNLKKSITQYDNEKTRNVNLNAEVDQIKSQIKGIESEGISSENELKILNRQKEEIERKLAESNNSLKIQSQQIQELSEVLRKVNADCYFYYEKDNATEEAKIYLTPMGVSEKYVKYFVRNKPDIYVDFRLTKDFFNYNVEKVDLKLYNSLNIEIYAVSKAISAENLKIIIPNKNYPPGKYSIELMAEGENLLVDNKYSFKISN